MKLGWLVTACLSCATGSALAQDASDPPAARVPATTSADAAPPASVAAESFAQTPADCCLLPNGTPVEIEIAEALSSRVHKRGDKFALRLAVPVSVDGQFVLPAGTVGVGEIVHAARPGMGGKPGELLLAARYLESNGQRIPLRGFRLGGSGEDLGTPILAASTTAVGVATAVGTSISTAAGFGVLPLLVHGKQAEIQPGTRARAKLAADTHLSPTASTTQPKE